MLFQGSRNRSLTILNSNYFTKIQVCYYCATNMISSSTVQELKDGNQPSQLIKSNFAFNQPFHQNQDNKGQNLETKKKNERYRQESRRTYIENMKKTVRFNWDVERTLEYLKSIDYQTVDSEQILMEAIDHQNLDYLVNLVVQADPIFKTALLARSRKLLDLIEDKIETPSSVLLLGNLCALERDFIKLSIDRKLMTRLMDLMNRMKANLKCCEIYSWTLTQMAREPSLLQKKEVQSIIPMLYNILSQYHAPNETSRHLCTQLWKLVAQLSASITFPSEFLNFLLSSFPTRDIDRLNMYLALKNQIESAKYQQNSLLQIKLANYLIDLYPSISKNLQKPKQKSTLYVLLVKIVQKSENQVSDYLITERATLIFEYQYGNLAYYNFIFELLARADQLPLYLENFRNYGLIENLVNDISDLNAQVGFLCAKNMRVIVETALAHEIEIVQWIIGLGLASELEKFLSKVHNNQSMAKLAHILLDLINEE